MSRLPMPRMAARCSQLRSRLSIGSLAANEEAKQLLIDAIAQSPGYSPGATGSPHAGFLLALILKERMVAQQVRFTRVEAQYSRKLATQ